MTAVLDCIAFGAAIDVIDFIGVGVGNNYVLVCVMSVFIILDGVCVVKSISYAVFVDFVFPVTSVHVVGGVVVVSIVMGLVFDVAVFVFIALVDAQPSPWTSPFSCGTIIPVSLSLELLVPSSWLTSMLVSLLLET